MTFKGIIEQNFLNLRNQVLEILLNLKAFYILNKNGKTFLIKKSDKTFNQIISKSDDNFKSLFNQYFNFFNSKEEAFYCLRFKDSPFNHRCCICRCFSKFQVSSNEYGKTCGNKDCSQKLIHSESAKEKTVATNLKKYGVTNVAKLDDVKQKSKKTCLEKYGTEYALQSELVQEKRKNTNLIKYGSTSPFSPLSNNFKNLMFLKYGVDNPFKSETIKLKLKITRLEKYGFECATKSETVKRKIIETRQEKFEKTQKELNATLESIVISMYGNGWYLKRKALDISPIFFENNVFIKNDDIEKIKEYSELHINQGKSHAELEIQNFVKSFCVEAITNTRSVIPPKELDVYVPSKKVAIEFDGIFWHSSYSYDENYHLNKTIACERQGIRLIHIFSDEWIFKKDICKSLIMSALRIYNRRLFARNCIVKEIDLEIAETFLKNNYLKPIPH